MSTGQSSEFSSQSPPASARPFDDGTYEDRSRGTGWVAFAGVMILVLGTLNVIYGIAAIDNSSFYVNDAKYIFSDLNTYGWIVLCIGVVQVLVGFGIFARVGIARWTGVLIAALNCIAQLLFIPAYPLASLAVIAIDVLIIYGLIAHGHKLTTS